MFSYTLTARPFNIGTYPKNDTFLQWNDNGTTYGAVTYSAPLKWEDIRQFELAPDGLDSYNGKSVTIGEDNYPATLEVIRNAKRGFYSIRAVSTECAQQDWPMTLQELISLTGNF